MYKEMVQLYESKIKKAFPQDIQFIVLKCQAKKFVSDSLLKDEEVALLIKSREQMRSQKYKALKCCIDIVLIHYYQKQENNSEVKSKLKVLSIMKTFLTTTRSKFSAIQTKTSFNSNSTTTTPVTLTPQRFCQRNYSCINIKTSTQPSRTSN